MPNSLIVKVQFHHVASDSELFLSQLMRTGNTRLNTTINNMRISKLTHIATKL